MQQKERVAGLILCLLSIRRHTCRERDLSWRARLNGGLDRRRPKRCAIGEAGFDVLWGFSAIATPEGYGTDAGRCLRAIPGRSPGAHDGHAAGRAHRRRQCRRDRQVARLDRPRVDPAGRGPVERRRAAADAAQRAGKIERRSTPGSTRRSRSPRTASGRPDRRRSLARIAIFVGSTRGMLLESVLVGLVAVPLAPVAKDVATALKAATDALRART